MFSELSSESRLHFREECGRDATRVWLLVAGGDHHLLQLAYNLDSTEPFIQDQFYHKAARTVKPLPGPPNGRVGSGFVSWNSHAIMKDNRGRRDYFFTELVSEMGGSDVSVIEPPFCILPVEDGDIGTGAIGDAGVIIEEKVINNIPYAYAIPMLTGWDIGYAVGDQHVKEIGVSLDEFQWQLNDPQRVLRYKVSSVVRDRDDSPANFFRHRVTILGLRPLDGVKLK